MARKRVKKAAPKQRVSVWKLSLLALVLAMVVSAVAYIRVDGKVGEMLASGATDYRSAIFSAPLRLSPPTAVKMNQLVQLLNKRNYREVAGQPTLPGEYSVGSGRLTLYTREFSSAKDKEVPAEIYEIDFENNTAIRGGPESRQVNLLALEPMIVSSLGTKELRASNYKSLEQIPEHVKQAVIAVEDERFYSHHGVDPEAILRAMIANIKALDLVQGGSTLTQQLAKNVLFTPEKTFGRKFMELLAAISLERRLSKDEILERYLNEIYLGQEGSFAIHGVAEASQVFFGKKIEDITPAEAALLAGIIRAPSYYSPRRHFERALQRKDLALEKMHELGYLDLKSLNRSKQQKIIIAQEIRNKRAAPFFIAALEKELADYINTEAANKAGLRIYTGLNFEMQECAETALTENILSLEKRYPKIKRTDSPLEGGLVAIEPQSGLIRAWAGGRDFSEIQFNHVDQAVRQIGSTIKPFLYLTALDGSLNSYKVATTTSVLSDEPVRITQINQRAWQPENYDHTYKGDVTLRYALETSLNLPAVYTAQRVGLANFARTVANFNIADNVQALPALALGAADTTLLRLTAAYAALANGGIYVAPRLFLTAENKDNEIIVSSEISERRVAEEGAVYVLTDILGGVVERGTARAVRSLGFTAPAAGKTGTSNDTRDAWFIGFTPDLAVGVWLGFDDNKKLGLTGGAVATPIWTEFMQCVKNYHQVLDFIPPPNVISVDIDSTSLDRAGPGCPAKSVVREIYVRGTEPRRVCSLHNRATDEEVISDIPSDDRPPRRRRGFWEGLFG